MEILATEKYPKISFKYVCQNCDYKCSKTSEYNKHLTTQKHFGNTMATDGNAKISKPYNCINCNKGYNDRSGLWKHNKKCVDKMIYTQADLYDEQKQEKLITYLIKENSEFKQFMMEQNKQMMEQNKQMMDLAKNSAGHHNVVNNNNHHFNLQFYLNETCKNAMNIMDFVGQLQVGLNELEETGRLGFAEGISTIFINGLKQINVSDRPLHCSNFKKETLYIKNNNEWNKESDDKSLLTNAIKHVAHKNMKQISEWSKTHSEYNDPESKVNDKYLQIVSQSMSGSTKEETNKNYSKIIKNILKETLIDKSVENV